MTVRLKLTVLTSSVMAMAILGMSIAIRVQLKSNLLAEVDRELLKDTASVESGPDSGLFMPSFKDRAPQFEPRAVRVESNSETRVFKVLQKQGWAAKLEFSPPIPTLTPLGQPNDPAREAADPAGVSIAAKRGSTYRDFTAPNGPMRSLSVPIPNLGKPMAVVQATRSLVPLENEMSELDRTLFALVPLAVLVSAGLGTAFVGAALRPTRRLSESARDLSAELNGDRLPVAGNDEFAQLAATLNQALDRTEDAFQRQRQALTQLERFTGDAGHELRTPLTALKAATSSLLSKPGLDSAIEAQVRTMDRSADRMAKLIDDLLLLARQDGGHPMHPTETVEIAALIEEAREDLTEPKCVEIELCLELGLTILANPDAARRIFLNLMSNAAEHARSHVTVRTLSVNGIVRVLFQDDGEGIDPNHLPRLGERFYRSDLARTRGRGGTGLGLAIVKSLCATHEATLRLESQVGVGTTVTVDFPRHHRRNLDRPIAST